MRRGRHSPAGYGTDPEAAQQRDWSTAASSTGTTAGARATGIGGEPTTTPAQPTRGYEQGYERGTAPSAGYRGEVTGAARADTHSGGVFSIVAGLLAFLAGLSAIVRASFYPTLAGYAYSWPIRNWGIVLLVLGVLLFALGACATLGMGFARLVAVGLAALTAVAGFLFVAFAPIWGVIIVGISAIAIWGLLHDSAGRRESV
jgi:hypothetical protein